MLSPSLMVLYQPEFTPLQRYVCVYIGTWEMCVRVVSGVLLGPGSYKTCLLSDGGGEK